MVKLANNASETLAIRGSILHFLGDPGDGPDDSAFQYFEDGLLIIEDGYISKLGKAAELMSDASASVTIHDYSGQLIIPGFVDAHTHFVQTDVIGSFGRRLLDWLDEYTYPAERAFEDPAHARATAEFFVDELLRNGTTTALVLGSVHRTSVDAVFEAALDRNMRLIAGKVLMDRNCPEYLRDTAETGHADSQDLIERWHKNGRLQYAITPRFAITSTPEQLELAGGLASEHPDVYVHTHLAESKEEVAWVSELFPDQRSYLDVYDHFGLLRRRSVMAHGIWMDERDRERLSQSGTAIAHCPSCNLFMGSGLYDLATSRAADVRTALGTDVGGGTSFSMLDVMHDAYKVAQLRGASLSPWRAFYLATLAGARALDLEDSIGNFLPGKEADFVVIDPKATPLLKRRMESAASLAEQLFSIMILGDDRIVANTYVMGRMSYKRIT